MNPSWRQALLDVGSETGRGVVSLTSAVEKWHRLQREHGLRILDDHDAQVASGVYAPVEKAVFSVPRIRVLTRSWELFDRAYEALPASEEARVFDEEIWPFLAEAGLLVAGEDFAADHLFVLSDGRVASFPAETWDTHLCRVASRLKLANKADWDAESIVATFRADGEYLEIVGAVRRIVAAANQ